MKQTKIPHLSVLLLLATFSLFSCTEKFDELNTDKTKLTELDAVGVNNAFAAAQYRAVQASWQTFQSLFADLQSQYYANVAINFPSDRNVMVGSWLNGAFNGFYSSAIPPLLGVLDNTKPGGPAANPAIYAVANIWKVQAFLPRTDYWGPIPYSKVGSGDKSIEYDTQEAIYKDFFAILKQSVQNLQAYRGQTLALGANDQVYNGNVDKWIRFANSMRLRLALRVSAVDPALAKSEAEAAVAGGVLTSNVDDALLKTTTNSLNPMCQATAWNEFRMSAAMESVLKGYNDPRMNVMYAPAAATGQYKGLRNGYSQVQLGLTENGPNANSNVATRYLPDNMFSTPFLVMYAAESWFLRAEGALNGWAMGGLAKDLYESGIRTSMASWGFTGAAVNTYIAGTTRPIALTDGVRTPALSDIPVRFEATAAKQREQILTQKWIANWPNGHEAWAEFRRTGFPKLYPRINSDEPLVPGNSVVRRTPYTSGELATNPKGVASGVTKLGGPDNPTTRLWWNK
ncbi:MAG: SusD/RagB family nutrient-binding outer membrane lipoprotein [Bacteroidetes bacterium]|nr:SusD/RagB family nutrient-binding outer membrane lipoprotein [Bacteroidota bacterium]